MSSVDDRIVAMKFDNKQFETGVAQTMSTMDKLKQKLNFDGASKGLSQVSSAASKINLGPLGTSIEGMSAKFLTLSTVAITALAGITTKAIDAGVQLGKSLTIDPIKQGFEEYETQMGSIQTVLANTASAGTTLEDVNGALAKLNKYSDDTIYNFSEMARNIGTFTAAGVDLDTSVNAIKGIANVAAISGSNSQQASTAMYQLSQAIANGKVGLQDWNSVVNAGMGGEVFQSALYETAKAMGTIKTAGDDMSFDEWTKAGNSFRNSLQDGWITGEVLTTTLEGFTGDLTDAQLKSKGYNAEQIKQIRKMGQMGQDAATKVKTMTQLIGTLKEGVGSGWSQTWAIIFGDFGEAKTMFSSVSDALGGIIESSSKARNSLLKDWKKWGGRTNLLEGFKNIWDALLAVIKPVKQALDEVFPPTTASQLARMTKGFREFTENLKIGGETSNNIKRIFRGLFSLFSIGWQVIKGVASVFQTLFGAMTKGSGGTLNFLGKLGNMVTNFAESLKDGDKIQKFFDVLAKAILVPVSAVKALAGWIKNLFGGEGGDPSKAGQGFVDNLKAIGDKIKDFFSVGDKLSAFGQKVSDTFNRIKDALAPIAKFISEKLGNLGAAITDAMGSGNFDNVIKLINTGLLGGIGVAIAAFLKKGFNFNFDFGGGLLESIKGTFGELTGALKTMTLEVKANALIKIAAAIAILAGSIALLALIEPERLMAATGAIGAAMLILMKAMGSLEKVAQSKGFAKIPVMAFSLGLLAGAIYILALAAKKMSGMEWEEIGKGLAGISGALLALMLALKPISNSTGSMLKTGAAMLILGFGLKSIAGAVAAFALLEWKDLGKGLAGATAALIAIGGAMRILPAKSMFSASIGMIAVAFALKLIADAIVVFAGIDFDTMKTGLLGIGASLGIIAIGMRLMPKGMLKTALGLIVVAGALEIIADVLAKFAGMTMDEVGQALKTLAISLGILAIALKLMSGTVMGAIALGIASAALYILAGALAVIGQLDWGTLIKGLVGIAGVFLVLGLAGLILTPVIPMIVLLGLALLAMGAAMLLAGVGALMFAKAFAILVSMGSSGIAVLKEAILMLVGLIPEAATALAEGLITFVEKIGEGAPRIIGAIEKLLTALLDAIIRLIPKAGEVFNTLIDTLLDILTENIPKIAQAGLDLLLGILKKIDENIPKVAEAAVDIVQTLMDTLAEEIPELAESGADMIIKLLNGLSDAIDDKATEIGEAGGRLASSLIEGVKDGIWAAVSNVASTITDMFRDAVEQAKDTVGNLLDNLNPFGGSSAGAATAGENAGTAFAKGLSSAAGAVTSATDQMVSDAARAFAGLSEVYQGVQALDSAGTRTSSWFNITAPDMQEDFQHAGGASMGAASYSQAAAISHDRWTSQNEPSASTPVQETNINFEQNIYSPKPVNHVEVYRDTRSLLSQQRRVVSVK
jgi:tape measure domain